MVTLTAAYGGASVGPHTISRKCVATGRRAVPIRLKSYRKFAQPQSAATSICLSDCIVLGDICRNNGADTVLLCVCVCVCVIKIATFTDQCHVIRTCWFLPHFRKQTEASIHPTKLTANNMLLVANVLFNYLSACDKVNNFGLLEANEKPHSNRAPHSSRKLAVIL